MKNNNYKHHSSKTSKTNGKRKIAFIAIAVLVLITLFIGYQFYTYYLPNFKTESGKSDYIYMLQPNSILKDKK